MALSLISTRGHLLKALWTCENTSSSNKQAQGSKHQANKEMPRAVLKVELKARK